MNNKKAPTRSGQADCVSNLKADTTAQSNQMKISGPTSLTPSAMKLAGKRKLGVKMPANF